MSLLTFEDFQPGETRTYGDYRLDEAELLEFLDEALADVAGWTA